MVIRGSIPWSNGLENALLSHLYRPLRSSSVRAGILRRGGLRGDLLVMAPYIFGIKRERTGQKWPKMQYFLSFGVPRLVEIVGTNTRRFVKLIIADFFWWVFAGVPVYLYCAKPLWRAKLWEFFVVMSEVVSSLDKVKPDKPAKFYLRRKLQGKNAKGRLHNKRFNFRLQRGRVAWLNTPEGGG